MFFIKPISLAAVILCLAFASTALAQQTTPTPQTTPQSPDAKFGFKNRVFQVKYREPEGLVNVLRLLASSAGAMTYNNEFKTITVRDFPENIATIEEAINRLDTPLPATPSIEFHVHILIATGAAAASNQFPAELNDVIKQLQSTLSYKNYYVMASDVVRTKGGGPDGIGNKGVADFKLNTTGAAANSPIFYDYAARPVVISTSETGASVAQIGSFNFSMRIPVEVNAGQLQWEPVGFRTPVSVREGEKVVVGTTTMQDKAVIVVITAKILK